MSFEQSFNKMSNPTKAYNKAHNGRASRRAGMHKKQNQKWFGELSVLQLPCPECWTIHKWNRGCSS